MPNPSNIGANNAELSSGNLGFIARITLTVAQIRALHTTAVQITPVPGVGQVIIPRWVAMSYNFGSVPYFSSTGSTDATFSLYIDSDNPLPVFSAFSSPTTLTATDAPSADIVSQSSDTVGFVNVAVFSDGAGTTFSVPTVSLAELQMFLTASDDFTGGLPLTTILHAAGTGYAEGDTVSDGSTLLATVDTVDGSGLVLTYHVTALGTTPYGPGVNVAMSTNLAPQAGDGTGFEIQVVTCQEGDGTLDIEVSYAIIG